MSRKRILENTPKKRARKIILDDSPKPYIIVDIRDARFWARMNQGNIRGEMWGKIVRKADRAQSRGFSFEIRWWKLKDRKDPEYGCGLIEVILKESRY